MNSRKRKQIRSFLKTLPLWACLIFVILFTASGRKITVQTVLNYTPENPLFAGLIILLLYAIKSISFVFPVVVLQVATGHLFKTPAALFINFTGRMITLAIPYWMGRFSGSDMADSLLGKYPKLKKICLRHGRHPLYISFLLRTFCFLPGDVVSLYLGAIKIPFCYYLAGGFIGTFLGVVLSTIFGASITEPGSPAFILSASLITLVAVVSFAFWYKNKNQDK